MGDIVRYLRTLFRAITMDDTVRELRTLFRFTTLADEEMTIHPLRLACFFASFICYVVAFRILLGLDEFRSILRVAHREKNDPRMVAGYFVLGLVIWMCWIALRTAFHYLELWIQKRRDGFWSRFGIVALGIPGNVIFPVCAAILAETLKQKAGLEACGVLLLCAFFVDLLLLDYEDLGMIDMFAVVHLSVLYVLGNKNILAMFVVAALCHSRVVLFFIVKEIVKWYYGTAEEAALVDVAEEATRVAEDAEAMPDVVVHVAQVDEAEEAVRAAEDAEAMPHVVVDINEPSARAILGLRELRDAVEEFSDGLVKDCEDFMRIEGGEASDLVDKIAERLMILTCQEVAYSIM